MPSPATLANGVPLVFAHRGGRAIAPENTLVAFDAGIAAGADGLEFDVHLSRDGQVVIIHDGTLERTTDGSGTVAGRTAAELLLERMRERAAPMNVELPTELVPRPSCGPPRATRA